MASYTIELRNVCEIYGREEIENWFKDYELTDYLSSSQIQTINEAGLWSKEKLARKIVEHYFMREIAYETPALFKHYAKVYMQEIMEEKLPLIYTNSIEYNPLINVDFTETLEREIEGNTENNGQSNSNSKNNASGLNINNNTPQTNIKKQDLETGAYATEINQSDTESKIEDETKTINNGKSNSTEKYTKHFVGNQGISATYQAMIKQFRENIIAVDKEIIEELNKLFFGLY